MFALVAIGLFVCLLWWPLGELVWYLVAIERNCVFALVPLGELVWVLWWPLGELVCFLWWQLG